MKKKLLIMLVVIAVAAIVFCVVITRDGATYFLFLAVCFLCPLFCYKIVKLHGRHTITANVLQLPEGGDFRAIHCQPSTNFDRSTKRHLTTEQPLLGRCC